MFKKKHTPMKPQKKDFKWQTSRLYKDLKKAEEVKEQVKKDSNKRKIDGY